MVRTVKDEEYLTWLPNDFFRAEYLEWKAMILPAMDQLVEAMRAHGAEAVVAQYGFSKKDCALMVKLGYFTEEEVEELGIAAWGDEVIE